jgi:hypothetical protein
MMIRYLTFAACAILSFGSPDDRVQRLRSFADSVKALIPADRSSTAGDANVDLLLGKTLQFIDQTSENDFQQGLEIMNFVCSSGIARTDVDETMWKAIGILCSPPARSSPFTPVRVSPVDSLIRPTEENPLKRSIETSGSSPAEVAITTIDPSELEDGQIAEESKESVPLKKRKLQVNPEAEAQVRPVGTSPQAAETRLNVKLTHLMSRQFTRRSAPLVRLSMRFLAARFVRMAKRGEFDLLLNNFGVLESVRAPWENMVFLFQDVHRIVVLKEEVADRPPVAFLPERERVPPSDQRFRAFVVDVYCRHAQTDRTSPSAQFTHISMHLAQRAQERNFASIDRTVEFLELAGVDRGTITHLLAPACTHLRS